MVLSRRPRYRSPGGKKDLHRPFSRRSFAYSPAVISVLSFAQSKVEEPIALLSSGSVLQTLSGFSSRRSPFIPDPLFLFFLPFFLIFPSIMIALLLPRSYHLAPPLPNKA
ncbi:uncharacterized protein BDW43DRAFT_100985 [Aspergillus alliaceus]|uniref:uncharacterized protein n=1 Tax=Petromyces alliaceus TaxID=209559 RepID=UPI0012A5F4B0|nr:uncharacterized protein BDW43DRAFT_100985 [Aspergillus alliaceus]KAB8233010.1 hypothetical protein BDW43DRAFT_100985 [Aspergillus alliaceus]